MWIRHRDHKQKKIPLGVAGVLTSRQCRSLAGEEALAAPATGQGQPSGPHRRWALPCPECASSGSGGGGGSRDRGYRANGAGDRAQGNRQWAVVLEGGGTGPGTKAQHLLLRLCQLSGRLPVCHCHRLRPPPSAPPQAQPWDAACGVDGVPEPAKHWAGTAQTPSHAGGRGADICSTRAHAHMHPHTRACAVKQAGVPHNTLRSKCLSLCED